MQTSIMIVSVLAAKTAKIASMHGGIDYSSMLYDV